MYAGSTFNSINPKPKPNPNLITYISISADIHLNLTHNIKDHYFSPPFSFHHETAKFNLTFGSNSIDLSVLLFLKYKQAKTHP